jgi:hypothetical protein
VSRKAFFARYYSGWQRYVLFNAPRPRLGGVLGKKGLSKDEIPVQVVPETGTWSNG